MTSKEAYDILTKKGFSPTIHSNYQVNAPDRLGVVQSFYPTTGTIVLHDRNGDFLKKDYPKSISIKNTTIQFFIALLDHPDFIQEEF